MNKSELEKAIAEKQAEIEAKQKEIDNFEIDIDEYEDEYCNMIDEMDVVRIGSLEYQASYVLREIDPTAYRCGLIDYVDSLEVSDDPAYKELEEELETLEDELTDLESELEELEEEEDDERE